MKTLLTVTCLALCIGGAAWAQGAGTALPASPPAPAKPNAITPPNGVARGVIPPPRVDPDMVQHPPPTQGTMPVLKPPAVAR